MLFQLSYIPTPLAGLKYEDLMKYEPFWPTVKQGTLGRLPYIETLFTHRIVKIGRLILTGLGVQTL